MAYPFRKSGAINTSLGQSSGGGQQGQVPGAIAPTSPVSPFSQIAIPDLPSGRFPGVPFVGPLNAGPISAALWQRERLDSVTLTVKTSGGDFTTIQDAINWLKGKLLTGSCLIVVDAGSWTATTTLLIKDLFIGASGSLTIQGDTRALVGMTILDNATLNPGALSNGGSGVGSLANATTVLTITGSTTNPDFDVDPIVSGDIVWTMNNTGTVATFTVSSALNNAITLTATAPTVGNTGSAICIQPNRTIVCSTAGPVVTVDAVRGVKIKGFYIDSSTGTDCDGVKVINGGSCEVENVLTDAEDWGFHATGLSSLFGAGGAISAWNCTIGFVANVSSVVSVKWSRAIKCSAIGYLGSQLSNISAEAAGASRCGTGFRPGNDSSGYFFNCFAHLNTTGYSATERGWADCTGVSGNNSGNTANYNPVVVPPAYAQGTDYGVILAT